MKPTTVRLGFVPSYRWSYTDWVDQMRRDSLAAFAQIPGVEIVCPQPAQDGKTIDPPLGVTAHGCVNTLDEAEAVAAYFRREGVDGLILSPLDFGDERSAVKVAEQMGLPVLLFATKEPPANNDAMLSRVSDSYCGNLSMASALYRRKIPFHFAGIFFPSVVIVVVRRLIGVAVVGVGHEDRPGRRRGADRADARPRQEAGGALGRRRRGSEGGSRRRQESQGADAGGRVRQVRGTRDVDIQGQR